MMNYYVRIDLSYKEVVEYCRNSLDDIEVIYAYRLCKQGYADNTCIKDSGRFDLYLGVFQMGYYVYMISEGRLGRGLSEVFNRMAYTGFYIRRRLYILSNLLTYN